MSSPCDAPWWSPLDQGRPSVPDTSSLQLDVYHVADVVEQLEVVFGKLHVSSLSVGELMSVLSLHITSRISVWQS